MKKVIFLFFALLVVGLAFVSAQDEAKIEQLVKELEQIQARAEARGGTYTQQELQRIPQIQQEMMAAIGPAAGMVTGGDEARRGFEQGQQLQRQNEQATRQQQQANQQAQAQKQLGDIQGWPPSAWLTSRYARNFPRLSSLRQPAGTTARYDREGSTVYLSGGNANTVIQDLVRQVQIATGQNATNDNGVYDVHVPDGKADWHIRMWQEDGTVRLQIYWSM